MYRPLTILLACLVVLATYCPESGAAEFSLDPSFESDTVYFRSSAKLEFINGMTNSIEGTLTFNPNAPADPIEGRFRVDLTTLQTGITTRDKHMRDRNLHTDKYPYAYFEIDTIPNLPDVLSADTEFSASTSGQFYIHGKKRKTDVSLTFQYSMEAGKVSHLLVRAKFLVKLDEFGIPRPRALFLKVADTIEVEVVMNAYPGLLVEQIELPKWPTGH